MSTESKELNDADFAGRLVYLTRYLEVWYKEINPLFNVPVVNRLAKIIKVFDWDTDEGKLLLSVREKTGKWNKLDPKVFKFVLSVYYPELIVKNSKKVKVQEVVPRYYPGTKNEMFSLIPDWMLKDLMKEEKNAFTVVEKEQKA